MKISPREKRRHAARRENSPRRVSPFLAWVDFRARSPFARSTIPEEKWGTTRSLRTTLVSALYYRRRDTDKSPTLILFSRFTGQLLLPTYGIGRIGPLFTHKNANLGAISATGRSCCAPVSKAESHNRIGVHTILGRFSCRQDKLSGRV